MNIASRTTGPLLIARDVKRPYCSHP